MENEKENRDTDTSNYEGIYLKLFKTLVIRMIRATVTRLFAVKIRKQYYRIKMNGRMFCRYLQS